MNDVDREEILMQADEAVTNANDAAEMYHEDDRSKRYLVALYEAVTGRPAALNADPFALFDEMIEAWDPNDFDMAKRAYDAASKFENE